ncbi:semaphorin-4E-like [Megalops cyprinoides]|uniref:semaphorin-4E-like n=1 Tax=Megalops cyprinoides TaxID=118141 RepID=UPI0018653BB0|nr:semaphorin-4E-like [Megalops cyprinoides]
MHSVGILSFFCLLFPALVLSNAVPRITVPYQDGTIKLFKEEGTFNYTTFLLREDLGLLILGARDAVYALDLNDISTKKSEVHWNVIESNRILCSYKGKNFETDCRNYIRVLHKMDDGRMYVCGTNAYSPTCGYMTYSEGQLKLGEKFEDGKAKCPFDPFMRASSVMLDGYLYSGTSTNFMGYDLAFMRFSLNTFQRKPSVRTTESISALNEPIFVHMDVVRESENSSDGDDDKVYMFFSENAVEYDFPSKLMVSRVARVCKGDLGGHRLLYKRWTSFLKARLDCPVPGSGLPYVVQDVFFLQHTDWRKSIFYAVFTPQSGSTGMSAVCAYSVSAIGDVFTKGTYKTPVKDTYPVKWQTFQGKLPNPRPGACINNVAKDLGIDNSLNLPDKTLQFVWDHPLMDEVVQPLNRKPLLVKKGSMFTRIVVDHVTALDGQSYDVMFIGTENGFVQKAVSYDGEMVIIEEVQLFQSPEPVKILRLSSNTSQLYAGSETGAVQLALSECGRYTSCLDCVLARDPYCAWDSTAAACTALSSPRSTSNTDLIQSVKEGNAFLCPNPAIVKPENYTLIPGNNINLRCQPDINLAQMHWYFNDQPLNISDTKYFLYSEGMMILDASAADEGQYICQAVEQVKGQQYLRTVAAYHLQLSSKATLLQGNVMPWQVSVTVLSIMMFLLLVFTVYQRHHSSLEELCK